MAFDGSEDPGKTGISIQNTDAMVQQPRQQNIFADVDALLTDLPLEVSTVFKAAMDSGVEKDAIEAALRRYNGLIAGSSGNDS